VAVGVLGCGVPDAGVLEANAAVALDLARRFGDRALETRALAEGGLALVSLGRIDEGLARLDEAMTLATGPEINDPMTIHEAGCNMMSACTRVGDLARAEAWLQVAEDLGLYGPDSPVVVAGCSTACGTLLRDVGRWPDAERMLVAAVEASDRSGNFLVRLIACTALAELRIHQGRLEEAERLLLGFDDQVEAAAPLAQLYIARADHDLAAAVARRGVRLLGADLVRAVPLLLRLVEAELGRGDLEAAEAAALDLATVADKAGLPTAAAQAALAAAEVAAARGQAGVAAQELEEALAALGSEPLPLLRAAIHFLLARLHAQADRASGVAYARAAVAVHARVGAPIGAEAARLLHDLGLSPPSDLNPHGTSPGAVPATTATLRRDGTYWTVGYGDAVARLRDSKGIAYLADLLAHPGVERHVFDLVDLVEGVPAEPGVDRRHLGDAGAYLDSQAKNAYRRRLHQLREAMDDADAYGDQRRAEQIQAEIDALVAELARAIGLDGRDRRAACAAEKARVNVTRAVRTAISRIGQAHPCLGEHLDRHVKTGTFCSYQPGTDAGVAWAVGAASP
jgi:tetratricopeptide (TPR) repeat protein